MSGEKKRQKRERSMEMDYTEEISDDDIAMGYFIPNLDLGSESESESDFDKERRKIIKETGAYELSCFPGHWLGCCYWPRIPNRKYCPETYDDMISAATFAIDCINARCIKMGKTYKFVDLKKMVLVSSFDVVLAFTAQEFVDAGAAGAGATVKSLTLLALVYQPGFEDPKLIEWKYHPDDEDDSHNADGQWDKYFGVKVRSTNKGILGGEASSAVDV